MEIFFYLLFKSFSIVKPFSLLFYQNICLQFIKLGPILNYPRLSIFHFLTFLIQKLYFSTFMNLPLLLMNISYIRFNSILFNFLFIFSPSLIFRNIYMYFDKFFCFFVYKNHHIFVYILNNYTLFNRKTYFSF